MATTVSFIGLAPFYRTGHVFFPPCMATLDGGMFASAHEIG